MATTNINTDKTLLSTDIYDVSSFIDQIRKDNITDINDTAAYSGIFGYLNEIHSQALQNTLIEIAETSNEVIPTRAKFAKNILAHAYNLGVRNINAIPASMTLMIYLPIDHLLQNLTEFDSVSGRGKFILDKNTPINIQKFEYHLDYDVIINMYTYTDKSDDSKKKYTFTAMYDLFKDGTNIVKQENPISHIYNPYITTVNMTTIKGVDYVGFSANFHQVECITERKIILTNNNIENKAITFEFGEQLAAFDVDVYENNVRTHLTPIYYGLSNYSLENGEWCWFEYIDANTIRIIFDKMSYLPGLNADVYINIKLTKGSSGNFTYNEQFKTSLKSERFNNYNGMSAVIIPLRKGNSNGGIDKKSIEELRRLIPREASARGNVINTTDLNNFFNSINDPNCRIYFKKKRDNPFERIYFAYMLMKKNGYVYPTNTLPLRIHQYDFKGFSANNNLAISPGTVFYYYDHGELDQENAYCTVTKPIYEEPLDEDVDYPVITNSDGKQVRVFSYISPFLITIDDDLVSSYFLTCMNEDRLLEFYSVNLEAETQFVATNVNCKRKFIYQDEEGNSKVYDNKYIITMDIVQNNTAKNDIFLFRKSINSNGDVVYEDIRVRSIMVFYADETATAPYRYVEGVFSSNADSVFTFTFTVESDDLIDLNNRINIIGVNNAGDEALQKKSDINNSHGYMTPNVYTKIFLLVDFGTREGDVYNGTVVTKETEQIILYGDDGIGGRTELNSMVPTREDVINAFLRKDAYLNNQDGSQYNVVTIIRSNPDYLNEVKEYNGNNLETEAAILKYLRNNKKSNFVQNVLLKDARSIEVIESYSYLDLDRYSVCNTMVVEGGINFYHDYSWMMRSVVTNEKMPLLDSNGNPTYHVIERSDYTGATYNEYIPIYETNNDGVPIYRYTVNRMPMIKNEYLWTEELMQSFITDLEERRKYVEDCCYVMEDTFELDLKFFNTFGPSNMFYYNAPNSENYEARINIKVAKIVTEAGVDVDDDANIVARLGYGSKIQIDRIEGLWARVISPVNGWIRLDEIRKSKTYIDNVGLTLRFHTETVKSADKSIVNKIIPDIKEYMEDINQVNELHIPNIITLITNAYREQLVYFDFDGINLYDDQYKHLYLDEKIDADITPEFLNVTTEDGTTDVSKIYITVF